MTEEQKQRARDNYKKYYQKNKERILKYQKEYRKKKYETNEEYRDKVKKRWQHFKETFNEQHPDYHKEYNREYGKRKRNSYKTRCEKAIEYAEKHIGIRIGDDFIPTNKELLDILRGEK